MGQVFLSPDLPIGFSYEMYIHSLLVYHCAFLYNRIIIYILIEESVDLILYLSVYLGWGSVAQSEKHLLTDHDQKVVSVSPTS